MSAFRIGQIVPSSNTTMETEVPAMLNARGALFPDEAFTFHSARMRMLHVDPESLKRMDGDSDRCALELSDARCDVLAYACLVAIMAQGPGYHRASESRLRETAQGNGVPTPVLSSAGALIQGVQAMGVEKISIVTPYMKPLTTMVVDYIRAEGIDVVDSVSLEVADNLEVGRLDPADLIRHVDRLDTTGVDAVVLSACVQMPSLPAIEAVQDKLGLPVLTAATATVHRILATLGLETRVPRAGALLSGRY
ncbi:Asp/Glu racemase [Tsukamurella sp. 8F]|uniref:maleate cis-trans isomerase family protein n=1 Tax=unclassified Tsukamurella TaxID=2633480 RepID=UPI0023B97135|nr:MULTISPECIES: Asp/Glu racemase [unclassified Tsukamurella]MDF0529546.1 Asp/Glu racemase [Tsukamurella sp. 8J]MDF0585766.1 Asp/Glu racemase [Tsukamurella sp. 8F]